MIIQFNSTTLTREDLTSFPALRTTYRPFFQVLYKGSRIAFLHQHCLEKKVTYLWSNAVISYHFQSDHSSLFYLQLTVIIFVFLVLFVIPVETLDWENWEHSTLSLQVVSTFQYVLFHPGSTEILSLLPQTAKIAFKKLMLFFNKKIIPYWNICRVSCEIKITSFHFFFKLPWDS